jgi:hypothetical protein
MHAAIRKPTKSVSRPRRFLATIYRIWMMRHVNIPEDVSRALAKELVKELAEAATPPKSNSAKYIPVVAIVGGRSSRTTLVPAGAGCYRLQIDTAQRKAAHADTGDVISVELRLDGAPRERPVPPDLRAALKKRAKARKAFEALPPGHRRQFINWFDSAKSSGARQRRLVRALDHLLERALLGSPSRRQSKPKSARSCIPAAH